MKSSIESLVIITCSRVNGIPLLMQEDFLEVMKTYPESFKAMDLVAEHRLRSLHKSQAWQSRQQSCNETLLGSIIEQILQARFLCTQLHSSRRIKFHHNSQSVEQSWLQM